MVSQEDSVSAFNDITEYDNWQESSRKYNNSPTLQESIVNAYARKFGARMNQKNVRLEYVDGV